MSGMVQKLFKVIQSNFTEKNQRTRVPVYHGKKIGSVSESRIQSNVKFCIQKVGKIDETPQGDTA
ncbi:MAG: hypothetical protein AB2693_13520 [Candidatus Thiodiazotropha sp.]